MKNKIFFWGFIILGSLDILISAISSNIYMLFIGFYMFIFSGITVIIKGYEDMVEECFRMIDRYQGLTKKLLEIKKEQVDE